MNQKPLRPQAAYVLYWMTAFRRTQDNFSLQRAVEHANKLKLPLVVLEALRVDYRWAAPRFHQFIAEGMADQAAELAGTGVTYYPYLEPRPGAGRGLLRALAADAAVVVTDDFPCFFLPRQLQAAAHLLPVQLEAVDSNGLLPLRSAAKIFSRAYDFRRFLQRQLLPHLDAFPASDPVAALNCCHPHQLDAQVLQRWPLWVPERHIDWSSWPLDHDVRPVPRAPGGSSAARRRLSQFLDHGLPRYAEARNVPTQEVTSGLSPYLHFGHISAHEVFRQVMSREDWSGARVADKPTGSAAGWWGASPEVEAFVDQLITWRELGFNMCWQREDFDRYESLPDWAQRTLEAHRQDSRPHVYELDEFERAPDP